MKIYTVQIVPTFKHYDFFLLVGGSSSTSEVGLIWGEDVASDPKGNCPLFTLFILCQFNASIAALAAAAAAFAVAVCSIAYYNQGCIFRYECVSVTKPK